jgi:hypothetical protein
MSNGGGEIRRAVHEGIADGVRQHAPDTVGILARGLALLLLAAIAHYGLGLSLELAAFGTASSPFAVAASRKLRASRAKGQEDREIPGASE